MSLSPSAAHLKQMEIKWRQISLMTVCGPRKRHLLMVEAFNWLGQQVRLGQAVKFPVECLHPRVSVDSHTGLLVNYLEVMSGLEQFTICSCKMCGLCLFFFFYWTVFCSGLCVHQLFIPPLLHSSSNMLLTVASCLLLPGCGPNEYWFHSSNFLCLLSVKSIQRSEVSSGASSGQMRTRRYPKS